jgi:hypothetical protein
MHTRTQRADLLLKTLQRQCIDIHVKDLRVLGTTRIWIRGNVVDTGPQA